MVVHIKVGADKKNPQYQIIPDRKLQHNGKPIKMPHVIMEDKVFTHQTLCSNERRLTHECCQLDGSQAEVK